MKSTEETRGDEKIARMTTISVSSSSVDFNLAPHILFMLIRPHLSLISLLAKFVMWGSMLGNEVQVSITLLFSIYLSLLRRHRDGHYTEKLHYVTTICDDGAVAIGMYLLKVNVVIAVVCDYKCTRQTRPKHFTHRYSSQNFFNIAATYVDYM